MQRNVIQKYIEFHSKRKPWLNITEINYGAKLRLLMKPAKLKAKKMSRTYNLYSILLSTMPEKFNTYERNMAASQYLSLMHVRKRWKRYTFHSGHLFWKGMG